VTLYPRYRVKKSMHYTFENEIFEFGPGFDVRLSDFPDTHATYETFFLDEVVRDIKETSLRISDTMINENTPTITYDLPDGQVLELGSERFRIPEVLVNNQNPLENGVIGYSGIPQMIYDSVTKCDMEIRKELYSNIVLAGGNTLFSGFNDKVQSKVWDLTNQN
jgi:actin-like protein 6A